MGLNDGFPGKSPPGLDRLGVVLRGEHAEDADWLRTLYVSTRDDIASMPWPATVKAQVAAEQYRLQHAHYLTHHPSGDRLIILVDGERAGRLLIDRTTIPCRLVDLALEPLHRGKGIGAALIRWLQRQRRHDGIDLHVARHNPRAAALYARLGFVPASDSTATHLRLAWSGGSVRKSPAARFPIRSG